MTRAEFLAEVDRLHYAQAPTQALADLVERLEGAFDPEPGPTIEQEASPMSARKEGWGSLDNIRGNAHYFTLDGRSLCGRYLAITGPRWESNQERGPEPKGPNAGTCKARWRKAPERAPEL